MAFGILFAFLVNEEPFTVKLDSGNAVRKKVGFFVNVWNYYFAALVHVSVFAFCLEGGNSLLECAGSWTFMNRG